MPPEPATAAEHTRPLGSSQGGLRQYNERVVLQALRLHGALPAAELARLTQLTAQTISQITKRLEADGLLLRGEPVRGKVGQPSVPLSLNPDGAFAVGIKVGRRSLDVVLLDFLGSVRLRSTMDYAFPEPAALLAEVGRRVHELRGRLGPALTPRLQGIGIAAPLAMGGWQQLLGIEPRLAAQWDQVDLAAEVAALTGMPTELMKDTSAACVAELVAGRGRGLESFLYVFVDTFVGGGLVIDQHLRHGRHGNAGAIGSLPVGLSGDSPGTPAQLLSRASLLGLERRFADAGLDPHATTDDRALQPPWREVTDAWLHDAADGIALTIAGAVCLLDLDGVIIDGSFGRDLLQALLQELDAALQRYSWEGVNRPRVMAGTIGSDARAIGGAWLPLYANFAPDRALFLKEG